MKKKGSFEPWMIPFIPILIPMAVIVILFMIAFLTFIHVIKLPYVIISDLGDWINEISEGK